MSPVSCMGCMGTNGRMMGNMHGSHVVSGMGNLNLWLRMEGGL